MPVHASSRSTQVGGAPSTLGTVAPGTTAVGFGVVVVVVVVGFGVSSTRARSKVVVAVARTTRASSRRWRTGARDTGV